MCGPEIILVVAAIFFFVVVIIWLYFIVFVIDDKSYNILFKFLEILDDGLCTRLLSYLHYYCFRILEIVDNILLEFSSKHFPCSFISDLLDSFLFNDIPIHCGNWDPVLFSFAIMFAFVIWFPNHFCKLFFFFLKNLFGSGVAEISECT